MERERVALAALTDTIQARQKAVAATSAASAALEQARAKTAAAFGGQTSQFSQTVAQMEMEGAAWAGYYDKLAEAIQIANAPPPAAPCCHDEHPDERRPRPRRAMLPFRRFRWFATWATWTYPMVNGIFHGAQPESVELEVHEKNGHVDGTAGGAIQAARRAVPTTLWSGSSLRATSPRRRLRSSRLMTSDGTPGAIELIPGPAFNLLEVNFQTDPQAEQDPQRAISFW